MPEPIATDPFGLPQVEQGGPSGAPTPTPGQIGQGLGEKVGEVWRGIFNRPLAPTQEALSIPNQAAASITPSAIDASTPTPAPIPPIEPTAGSTFAPSVTETPNETPATIAATPTTEPSPTLTPVSSVPPEAATPTVPISNPQVIVPPEFGEPSDVPEPAPAAPVAPEPVIPPTPEPPTLLSNTFPATEPFAPTAPAQSEVMPSGAPVEQPPSIEEEIASMPDTIPLIDGSNPLAVTLELAEKKAGRKLTPEEHQKLLLIVYRLCSENDMAVEEWGLQGKIPKNTTGGFPLKYSSSVKEAILKLAA